MLTKNLERYIVLLFPQTRVGAHAYARVGTHAHTPTRARARVLGIGGYGGERERLEPGKYIQSHYGEIRTRKA
jgi:hypothetical protein